jgi:hypothetical protein
LLHFLLRREQFPNNPQIQLFFPNSTDYHEASASGGCASSVLGTDFRGDILMSVNSFARFAGLLLAALLLGAPAAALAAKSETAPIKAKPEGEVVELFAGIKSGEIEVTYIPKDAKESTILFKNNTGKPVAIKLPEAFAAAPVLAQFGGPGGVAGAGPGGRRGGGAAGLGGGGMGGMQGLGGGFGGMGGMMGGMGGMGMGGMGMGGFMNVAPDKTAKVKVKTVCLEHGKTDPNPRAKYEIRPIESFTQNASVIELCKMLGRGEVKQNTAQAAAWHLANGLSFEQLAMKNRIESASGYTEKFFTPQELRAAAFVAIESVKRGQMQKQPATVAKSDSLSGQ